MKIYLDDVRNTPVGYLRTYTIGGLKNLYKTFEDEIEEISLDHDLGDEDIQTGYDFLKWFEEELFLDRIHHVPILKIHSDNGPGIENMRRAIDSIERIRLSKIR